VGYWLAFVEKAIALRSGGSGNYSDLENGHGEGLGNDMFTALFGHEAGKECEIVKDTGLKLLTWLSDHAMPAVLSTYVSPQLYADTPLLHNHSYLFLGMEEQGDRRVMKLVNLHPERPSPVPTDPVFQHAWSLWDTAAERAYRTPRGLGELEQPVKGTEDVENLFGNVVWCNVEQLK
jgi:hypothetical protein